MVMEVMKKIYFHFSRALPDELTIISIRGDINIIAAKNAGYDISIDFNGNKTYDNKKALYFGFVLALINVLKLSIQIKKM